MVNVYVLALIFLGLVVPTLPQSVDGYDSGEGIPEYNEYYSDIDISPSSNETVTQDQVAHIIHEAVSAARSKVLTDPELTSLMDKKIKDFFNARRQCMLDESVYYDYVVGDCRSCLREHCDKDDICKTECRDILKLQHIGEDFSKSNEEVQRYTKSLNSLQARQSSQSQNYETWLIVLTVLVVIALLVVAPTAVIVVILLVANKEKLAVPYKPAEDERAERNVLIQAPQDPTDGQV